MSRKTFPFGVALLLLVLVGGYLLRSGRLPFFRTEVRALTIATDRDRLGLNPYGPGFEQELLARFSGFSNLVVRCNQVANWEQAQKMIASGQADLLLAPGIPPDSWDPEGIKAGPIYRESASLVIRHRKKYELRSFYDLCKYPLYIPDIPAVESKVISASKSGEIPCRPEFIVPEAGTVQDLLQFVSDTQARFALLDEYRLQPWEPFYPEIRRTYTFQEKTDVDYRWYWSLGRQDLASELAEFWYRPEQKGLLRRLEDKYSGYYPAKPDHYGLLHLKRVLQTRLQRYLPYIKRAAIENKLDPLLLVAMIYQESQFDPQAKSHTGVRGLMQVTRDTAQDLGLTDRLDPEQSILGGGRYLRQLWGRLAGKGLRGWDRWFVALAAYNQGLAHARDALRLTERLGKDPQHWYAIKSVFPLLSYQRYYKRLASGYARGFEAVDYVQSIRYYYYILHGLVVLSGPEAEHLAPLRDLVPRTWPG